MSRPTHDDLVMFATLNAGHPKFLAWLQAEREAALKVVVQGRDPVLIHRYQGEVTNLEKIIGLLTDANKHIASLSKGALPKIN